MIPPHDAFAISYKPVLHAMAGALTLSLAAAARNCELAMKAVNDSLAEAAELEKEIDAANDIPSLLEVQSKLARSWFDRATKNWGQLCEAAGENQHEVLRRGQAQIARIGEDIRAATVKGASPDGSMAGTWGSFMEAASSACALTAKATEEMTRMALAQTASLEALGKRSAKATARPH